MTDAKQVPSRPPVRVVAGAGAGRGRMSARCLVFVVTAALAAPLAAMDRHGEGAGDMPQVLYTSESVLHPLLARFVAADAAVNDDGTVDPATYRHEAIREELQHLLDQPAVDGCLRLEEVYFEEPAPDRGTLEEGGLRSELVFVGEVTGREYGFNSVEAGQLLQVRVQEVIKGEAHLRDFYVFYPAGTFTAGPYRICKVDRSYPPPPAIGESVLLMIPEVEDPGEPYLHLRNAQSVVVFPENGRPRLSRSHDQALTSEPSREEILAKVRRGARVVE